MKCKWIVIVLFFCSCAGTQDSDGLGGANGAGERMLLLQAESRVVKGFPVILRITARGPQRVPKLTLFSGTGEVRVRLVSTGTGTEYVISSTGGMDTTVKDEDGERRDDIARNMRLASVGTNEERTMLLDLFSLRPEIGRGTILDQVPPGKYKVSVRFPSSGQESNSVDLEMVAPTDKEKEFLAQVVKLGRTVRCGSGVHWCRIFEQRVRIPKDSMDELTETAKRQLAFHVLLSDALLSDAKTEALPTAQMKDAAVPEYLEPEKRFLLFELNTVSGRSKDTDFARLEKDCPGLRWRLDALRSNGRVFRRYKWK